MYSLKNHWLFVHIPKTGGNAIQGVLRSYADDEIVTLAAHQDGVERFEVRSRQYQTHKHSTLAEYLREYGTELLTTLHKSACVRNPWDRVVSYFFSPHRGPVEWSRAGFREFLETVAPVAHYLSLDESRPAKLESALANLDCLLRYESLQADFDRLCQQIGSPHQTLPVRNKSRRGDYRDYYDAESREAVARRFEEEVDCLGYVY